MQLLLVHHDDALRRSIAAALAGAGATVIEAASGGEALRAQRWCGPLDATIVDRALPDGSGPHFVEQLRQSASRLPAVGLGWAEGEAHPSTRIVPEQPRAEDVFHALEQLDALRVRVSGPHPTRPPKLDAALPYLAHPPEAEGLVIVGSPDGGVSYLNRTARRVLDLGDTTGLHLSDLSPSWGPPFPDGPLATDVELTLADGHRLRACQTYSVVPAPNGSTCTVIALRPLATHCPRIAEIMASEHRFRLLLDQLTVGVLVQDKNDRILISNPMACELLGLTEDQLHGKSSFDPEWHVIKENGERFQPAEHPSVVAMSTGQPVREVVMGVYRPRTQDRVWILVSAEPIPGPSGGLDRVIVTFSDVTQYKSLRDKLALTHRLRSIGTLAAGVAHDFNNILAAIMASVETLLLEPPNDEIREISEAIFTLTKRGVSLTRKLRTVANEQRTEPERVEVDRLLSELSPLLRRSLPRNVELELQLGAGASAVWIDPAELERVLFNLVVNARDAQPDGGSIRISSRLSRAGATEGTVEIGVSDEGSGIPPHIQPHVFEPMFSTKGPEAGTGLGLATAHGIITNAGGAIDFETSSTGTTFSLRLPEAPATEPAERPATSGARGTILIADDDAVLVDSVGRTLREAGYDVLTATDGAEATRLLEQRKDELALVLSDVVMPKGSGVALRERARQLTTAPVVLMSGHAFSKSPTADPSKSFLQKPFSRATLLEVVESAQRRDRAQ